MKGRKRRRGRGEGGKGREGEREGERERGYRDYTDFEMIEGPPINITS